jgi:hypothetical protein
VAQSKFPPTQNFTVATLWSQKTEHALYDTKSQVPLAGNADPDVPFFTTLEIEEVFWFNLFWRILSYLQLRIWLFVINYC